MKHVLFIKILYRSVFGLLIIIAFSCKEKQEVKTASNSKILPEIKASLDDLVKVWYPISIDSTNGGFYPDFNYKWEKEGGQNKMLVTQARHIWTASALADFYGDNTYNKIAAHGYRFFKGPDVGQKTRRVPHNPGKEWGLAETFSKYKEFLRQCLCYLRISSLLWNI